MDAIEKLSMLAAEVCEGTGIYELHDENIVDVRIKREV